jgi:hypothetical protein
MNETLEVGNPRGMIHEKVRTARQALIQLEQIFFVEK